MTAAPQFTREEKIMTLRAAIESMKEQFCGRENDQDCVLLLAVYCAILADYEAMPK